MTTPISPTGLRFTLFIGLSAALYGQESLAESPEQNEREERLSRAWYFGAGAENNVDYSISELYRLRAAQRSAFPLEYLNSPEPYENISPGGMNLFVGVELAKWLDVEVALHGADSFYQVMGSSPVASTTMTPTNPRPTAAHQSNSFYEETFTLTLLPRWNINRHVALYGRIGIGYSSGRTDSVLSISANVPGPPLCTKNDVSGVETCRPTTVYEDRTLSSWHQDRHEVLPVIGVGLRFFRVARFEYIYRSNVPIGETTTDISGTYISFCWPVGGGL